MYMDRQLTCSTGQNLAQAAGTYVSTDVIDLATSGRDVSRHNELRAYSGVGTAFASGGAGTLIAQLVQSDAADLSNPDVLLQSNGGAALALAALTAGTVLIDSAMPQTSKRYLGYRYIIGGAAMTAGTVTSGLVKNTQTPIGLRPTGNTGL